MDEITSQFERALILLREAASLQASPEVPLEQDFVLNLNARLNYLDALYRNAYGARIVDSLEEVGTDARQHPTEKSASTRAGNITEDPAYQELLAQAEQEEAAFMKLREELRQKHPEAKYVAMWNGVPRIFGQNLFEVAKKFLSEFGRPPGYIGELADVPQVAVFSSSFSG